MITALFYSQKILCKQKSTGVISATSKSALKNLKISLRIFPLNFPCRKIDKIGEYLESNFVTFRARSLKLLPKDSPHQNLSNGITFSPVARYFYINLRIDSYFQY